MFGGIAVADLRVSTQNFGAVKTRWASAGAAYDLLPVTWWRLRWAAITVGKPYVLRGPGGSGALTQLEIAFRKSLLDACLVERGSDFATSDPMREWDPSERGAAAYFLGMTIAKLLAAQIMNAPVAVHYSRYGAAWRVVAVAGVRSRPDLLAWDRRSNKYDVVEAKGTLGSFGKDLALLRQNAKAQAGSISSVNGSPPRSNIASVARFGRSQVRVDWTDPVPDGDDLGALTFSLDEYLRAYYSPLAGLFLEAPTTSDLTGRPARVLELPDADLLVALDAAVLSGLLESHGRLEHAVRGLPDGVDLHRGHAGGDGLYVGQLSDN